MSGRSGTAPPDIGTTIHGTTLATNAILEREGVRTGLLR
jgi:N-methylhydantoinase A/oxoprolinase/acetone carboxylase beta subunit